MDKIIKSKKFIVASTIVGIFILMLASFAGGVAVGFHKARFSFKFGENYERNFMAPMPGMMPPGPMGAMKEKFGEFEGRGFRNGHGLVGTIISISENSIVIKDRDNKENTVSVSDKTVINRGKETIKFEDLKKDDEIAVIGMPGENGSIDANLIRVLIK